MRINYSKEDWDQRLKDGQRYLKHQNQSKMKS